MNGMVLCKMEHYFSKKPVSALRETVIHAKLRGRQFEFVAGSGVFSKKRIDLGTHLLVDKCIISPNTEVLDLGCGYGAVGVVIAKTHPSVKVTLSDVNSRAVFFARKNVKKYRLKNAKVIQSDVFSKLGKFDTVLLNPPQTAGKKLCFRMIEESLNHLNPAGTLQLVARHQKGGKTLSEHMEATFGNLDTVAKGSGYRIYLSRKE